MLQPPSLCTAAVRRERIKSSVFHAYNYIFSRDIIATSMTFDVQANIFIFRMYQVGNQPASMESVHFFALQLSAECLQTQCKNSRLFFTHPHRHLQ